MFGGSDSATGYFDDAGISSPNHAAESWHMSDVIGLNWRGFVMETTLIYPSAVSDVGELRTMALTDPANKLDGTPIGFYNAVRGRYVEKKTNYDNPDRYLYTDWLENTDSIRQYGRHEIQVDGEYKSDASNADRLFAATVKRDAFDLVTHSGLHPTNERVGTSTEETTCRLLTLGWLDSAQFIVADPVVIYPATVSQLLTILIEQCPYLSVGNITANTTLVYKLDAVRSGKSVYAALQELASIAGPNNQLMRLYCDESNNHNVHYVPETEAKFYRRGAEYFDKRTGRKVSDKRLLDAGWYENRNTNSRLLYTSVDTRWGDGTYATSFNLAD